MFLSNTSARARMHAAPLMPFDEGGNRLTLEAIPTLRSTRGAVPALPANNVSPPLLQKAGRGGAQPAALAEGRARLDPPVAFGLCRAPGYLRHCFMLGSVAKAGQAFPSSVPVDLGVLPHWPVL